MKAKFLLFGASILTMFGITLLTLVLVSTVTGVANANTETAVGCGGSCIKSGKSYCLNDTCESDSTCACPGSTVNNKCPCGKK